MFVSCKEAKASKYENGENAVDQDRSAIKNCYGQLSMFFGADFGQTALQSTGEGADSVAIEPALQLRQPLGR